MGREPREPELRFEEVHGAGWETREVVLGPPKPPRSKWWWIAIPVTAALVAVAVTHGGSGDTAAPTSTTSPSTTVALTTTTATPSTTEVTDPISSTSTSTTAIGPVLPFGRPTGVSVLFMSWGPSESALQAYDIDTGSIHAVKSLVGIDGGMSTLVVTPVSAFVSNDVTVVKLGSPPVRLLAGQVNCSYVCFDVPIIAAGPKGGVWLRETADPSRIVLLDAQGNRTSTAYPLPESVMLYGSMADGQPVVQTPDARSYVIRTDGSHVLLGGGTTSYVRNGQYVETVCDSRLACSLMAHTGRPGQTASGDRIGDADRVTTAVFDATGRRVLVATVGGTSLVDLVTKSTTYIGSGTPNIGGPYSTFAAFLPGDLGLVTISPGGFMELYDLTGGSRASFPVNNDNGGGQLVGLVSTALLPDA